MTKHSKKVSLAKLTTAERWAKAGHITPELARHIGLNSEEREMGEPGKASSAVVLQLHSGPISFLFRRKIITRSQFEAAERLRKDFQTCGLDTLKAADYTREVVDGGGHKGEPSFQEDARRAFNAAIKALPTLTAALTKDVVLRDVLPADAESFLRERIPLARDRKVACNTLLQVGLIALAEHYGMQKDW